MAETGNKTPKKLADLRVIDLKCQLEQRGLETRGVKAALSDRLKKALQEEGKNPDEIVFDISDKKMQTPRKGNDADTEKENQGDEEVEETEDNTENVDSKVVVKDEDVEMGEPKKAQEPAKVEKNGLDKVTSAAETKPETESAAAAEAAVKVEVKAEAKEEEKKEPEKSTEEAMEIDDAAIAEAKVLDEVTDEDAINLTIEDEDKLLADEEDESAQKNEVVKTEDVKKEADKPEVNGAQEVDKSSTDKCEESAADSNKENKEMPVGDNACNATLSAMKVENPPSPTSVPVPQPSLTSEDTLKLHNTNDRKDDDISLIVHVDDTQNDLDNDLLGTPLKKPAAGEKDDNTDKAGAKDSVGDVTADPAAKAEDGAAGDDKKPAAAGSTSPKKTSTADPKKGTAAEGKKTEVKKEEAGKKTPEKKEAEKKDGDKTKSDAKSPATKSSSKDDKGKDNSTSSRNLWVSGLSSSTRATDLKTLFSKHGKVVGAKVVTNPRSPGSRCYGFVTMSSTEEASRCIQHLHRTELHGRMISVERAKNEPSVHPPTHRRDSRTPAGREDAKRDPKKDDKDKKDAKPADKKDVKPAEKKDAKPAEKKDAKPAEKKDAKPAEKKDAKPAEKKDAKPAEKKDAKPGEKKEEKKEDIKKEGDKKEESKKEGDKKEEGKKDPESKDGDKKDGDKKEGEDKDADKKDGHSSRSTKRHSTGDRHSTSSSKDRHRSSSRDKRDPKKEDVLSFQKIKAERERERLRQQERRLREEERWRARDLERERQRQREIAREQKEESLRLQRERDKIRLERERLERERLAVERAERERRLERERRERQEREREEARRLAQLRLEQERRPVKRAYDRSAAASRDDQYWQTEPKRAAITTDRTYNTSSFGDSRGFGDFSSGPGGRGGYDDSADRRLERFDRKDGPASRHVESNRFDDRRDDNALRRSRDVIPSSRDATSARDRDDRRFDDRRTSGSSDRGFERYDDRAVITRDSDRDRRTGGPADRRDADRRPDRLGSPPERRSDWKGDSRGVTHGASHRDRPSYDNNTVMKSNTSSGRDQWGMDSRKDSSWGQSSSGLGSAGLSRGQNDRWPASGSGGMRGSQHGHNVVMNAPLLQTPPSNQSFLTSAANIMMGVGMARSSSSGQDDRYNAYKNMSGGGNVRRY